MWTRTLALLVSLAAGAACGDQLAPPADGGPDAPLGTAPVVIVMIGDGMGQGALDAASLFRHGETGRLFMQSLPYRGELRTGAPSGITDSAAAATVMATGQYTWNGRVALDRDGAPVETLLERARHRGWAAGLVTTTSLPHATPAGFSAHVFSRHEYTAIADQQVRRTRPQVMLGGGHAYFEAAGPESVRTDGGLYDELERAGYRIVRDRLGLEDAVASGATELFGAFAPDQMTMTAARAPDTMEPDLPQMALAALTTLDRDRQGFFLMIEGGRIDHGGHANNLVDVVHETLAFDDTIALVSAWARARGNVTVIVTADHECGGIEIATARGIGEYPDVRWRWGAHTNARVGIFGEGPGAEVIEGVVDHRWVHAIGAARIDGAAFVTPAREPIPDGELGDLRHRAAVQEVASGYGVGFNQLDAMWLDATPRGLFVGIEGLFEWDANAVEVWIDVDPGSGTGMAGLKDSLSDRDGVADAVLAESNLSAPVAAGLGGFGADVALVAVGGADPHVEDLIEVGGLRGLREPFGYPDNLGWRRTALNFGAVRVRGTPLVRVPGQGLEAFVPWSELYPEGVPAGARVGLAAVLVNTDGGHTSNQALPSFPPGTENPGREVTPLPGVVLYELDADRDGIVDGDAPPVIVR
ncbi:MAG: alkaline phosphatase [Deltaproteobacteria bacterium]|nr:alkaline phosphatase [Kofleriaceae bacterium]